MNTAGRRRRQAIAGYPNIRPSQRPSFSAVTPEKSAARMMRKIANEKKLARA